MSRIVNGNGRPLKVLDWKCGVGWAAHRDQQPWLCDNCNLKTFRACSSPAARSPCHKLPPEMARRHGQTTPR